MRHWKNKNERSLQSSLTLQFFLFILSFLLAIFSIYLLSNYYVVKKYNDSQVVNLKIEASDYVNFPIDQINTLIHNGGWLETLDQNMKVKHVVGTKLDRMENYTEEQLFNLLANGANLPYYSSLSRVNESWLLLKIPRRLVNIATVTLEENQAQLTLFYIVAEIILVIVLLLVFSYTVGRRFHKVIRIIILGMRSMIDGNYDTRITLNAEKEFVEIGETFNYMADVIEKTTKARQKAEESKRRLIMDLSHDLKTPITSIHGYAQALSEGRVDSQERREKYFKYIYNKSLQVARLIHKMLDMLKTDSPDFKVNMKRHELRDDLREIIAGTYGDLEAKEFILQFNVPDQLVYASYDSELLYSIVHNLIENALIHNPSGTQLRVEIIPERNVVAIEIADNGSGIPEEIRDSIFDPFVRGDKARKTDGGTGLGLSIALKNSEIMGGTLELRSSESESTIFTVRIPK